MTTTKGMNSTPNCLHEQLLVGWKWGAMEMAREDNNTNNNNNNGGHQHLPDGHRTMTKMMTMKVGPRWDDEDHNDN
jgi:hypothetical protein